MNAFTRAAAALVADGNLGVAIIYSPATSPRVSCRGVFSRPVQEFGEAVRGALMVSITAADVAAPARGDLVILTQPLALGGQMMRADLELRVEKVESDENAAFFNLTLSHP